MTVLAMTMMRIHKEMTTTCGMNYVITVQEHAATPGMPPSPSCLILLESSTNPKPVCTSQHTNSNRNITLEQKISVKSYAVSIHFNNNAFLHN